MGRLGWPGTRWRPARVWLWSGGPCWPSSSVRSPCAECEPLRGSIPCWLLAIISGLGPPRPCKDGSSSGEKLLRAVGRCSCRLERRPDDCGGCLSLPRGCACLGPPRAPAMLWRFASPDAGESAPMSSGLRSGSKEAVIERLPERDVAGRAEREVGPGGERGLDVADAEGDD